MLSNDIFITLGAFGVFILGFITALHPCPLSINLGMLSIICSSAARMIKNMIRGLVLTSGICFGYTFLSLLLSYGMLSVPQISFEIPTMIRPFMAPLFILSGAIMTGIFPLKNKLSLSRKMLASHRGRHANLIMVFFLGCLLALVFCPATAGIFFAVLIPITLEQNEPILYPFLFGCGYGLFMILLTVAISASLSINFIKRYSGHVPKFFGWILILLGLYLTIQLF